MDTSILSEEVIKEQQEFVEAINKKKEEFAEKAIALGTALNTKVAWEAVSELSEQGLLTGKVFVAYFREPALMLAARALDLLWAQKINECGQMLWAACFLKSESSSEIESVRAYHLGMLHKVGNMLDAIAPDVKKN